MDRITQDQRSLYLLISLLLFLVLGAFVTHDSRGEAFLALSLCVALAAAALKLSGKPAVRRPGMLLAGATAVALTLCTLYPVRPLLAAGWMLLAGSFAFIAGNLFWYLGQPGRITSGRLYSSVSLYLMIATVFYALFNLFETLNPGSFAEKGLPPGSHISRHSLIYFSLVTLTTLGYGDIVPVTPPARMFAALESVTGVLYIAITVARLVASYESDAGDKS